MIRCQTNFDLRLTGFGSKGSNSFLSECLNITSSPQPSTPPDRPGLSPLPRTDRVESVSRALSDFIGRSSLKPGDRLPAERGSDEVAGSRPVHRPGGDSAISGRGASSKPGRAAAPTCVAPLRPMPSICRSCSSPVPCATASCRRLRFVAGWRSRPARPPPVAPRRRISWPSRPSSTRWRRVHLEKGTAGREDLAFHLAIYDATHNPLFRQLLEQIREAFESFFDKPFDRPDFARRSFPVSSRAVRRDP